AVRSPRLSDGREPDHADAPRRGEHRGRNLDRARPLPGVHLGSARTGHEQGPGPHGSRHEGNAMSRMVSMLPLLLVLAVIASAAFAATSTVVLAVEGMT